MMAFDSSHNPPGRLDDATVDGLRAALRAFLGNGGSSTTLKDALIQMSREARERGILPEQLLIVLKDTWSTLPEVRVMDNTNEQVRLLQRVVTMCIKEYYGT